MLVQQGACGKEGRCQDSHHQSHYPNPKGHHSTEGQNARFIESPESPDTLKVKVKVKLLSHVRLLATPWTVAYQDSPSMGFSRQEYWSGLLFPSPGDLPNPGIEPGSPAL